MHCLSCFTTICSQLGGLVHPDTSATGYLSSFIDRITYQHFLQGYQDANSPQRSPESPMLSLAHGVVLVFTYFSWERVANEMQMYGIAGRNLASKAFQQVLAECRLREQLRCNREAAILNEIDISQLETPTPASQEWHQSLPFPKQPLDQSLPPPCSSSHLRYASACSSPWIRWNLCSLPSSASVFKFKSIHFWILWSRKYFS